MTENRTMLIVVIAMAFITGLAVGVAGTLLTTRQGAVATVGSPGSGMQPAQGVPGTPSGGGQSNAQSAAQGTGVFINEKPVTQAQLDELKQAYGAPPPPGRYWYDPRSGLYGNWGYEAAGYIRAGHNFDPVPADASKGNTGVFINGRQINLTEAQFFQRLFGAVYQGHWWLDGQTGNVGLEGNPAPIANVVVAMQQASRSGGGGGGGGGGYRWRDNINNASGGAENGCVWINSPGSSYSSSGCN